MLTAVGAVELGGGLGHLAGGLRKQEGIGGEGSVQGQRGGGGGRYWAPAEFVCPFSSTAAVLRGLGGAARPMQVDNAASEYRSG